MASAKKKITAASALKITSLLPDDLVSFFSLSALLRFLVLPAVLPRVPVFFFLLFPLVFDAKMPPPNCLVLISFRHALVRDAAVFPIY
jgi:hypothetical protein